MDPIERNILTQYKDCIVRFLGENVAVYGVILMVVLATFINEHFLSAENIGNVLRQTSLYGMISTGMAIVLISGSIDLSVGSLYALTTFVGLYFSQRSTVLGVTMTLIAGTLVGLCNGFIIVKMRIHPWITTLAMSLALRGLVLILTGENTYKPNIVNGFYNSLSRVTFLGFLNYPIIIWTFVVFVVYLMLSHTKIGRMFYAVGGNPEAARMMGVKTNKTLVNAHVLCSVCTSVSGILLGSRMGAAYPLLSDDATMYAIASCVVGGVYLTGGRGKMLGVYLGTIIVAMLTNVFNMQRYLNTFWQEVVTGGLVLFVVLIQQINIIRHEKRKKFAAA
jgi:ribose/xylose/arabinose/galactoside ABC-type transport system permease subunit